MKLKNVITKFINIKKDYNLKMTINLFITKLFHEDNYNNLVENILIDESKGIINHFSRITHEKDITYKSSPIWVCWWQGYDSMPQLVLRCFKSIIDNCNGHDVNLITKYNYSNYVDIPEYLV